ncbi:Cytochrome c oxidase subunit 6B-like protein new16 [Smittium mucronatum]|uniref:Cytochrome c oxidase subunit 6B-like protein new16 n=1 Tax=Smittium mucronatum TaxID=133383 RepID=A0A1R0H5W2_9FUNG|nr:Cytochrome c oxidase subunit 6B-like protein new16 [Smittium mucronatum]
MSKELYTNNEPLTRAERKECHGKRDLYFECLIKNKMELPSEAGESICKSEKKEMYSLCPESWADYFIKLRELTVQRERALSMSQKRNESE